MILSAEKDILKIISAGTLRYPILIFGSEEFLKQQYLKKITKDSHTMSAFNDLQWDFQRLDIHLLADAAAAPPLMSASKTLLVYNFAPKQVTSEQMKLITNIFEMLSEDCHLVFMEKSGAFDEKGCEKSKKIIRLFDKHGTVLNAKERTDAELKKYCKTLAAKYGCEIEAVAIRELIDRVPNSILDLQQEIGKLCCYQNRSGLIKKEAIEQLTPRTPDDNVFALTRAISRKDYDGAMRILYDLFSLKIPPENILSVLSKYYVDLLRARAGLNKNVSEIAADFGYGKRTFAIENAKRDVGRVPEAVLSFALDVLQRADIRLKTGSGDARMLLEETVTSLFVGPTQEGILY